MLELRPTCENCNKPLPPAFCAACVDTVLNDVCPNCGGGFAPRPIRPAALLARDPAGTEVRHRPVDQR